MAPSLIPSKVGGRRWLDLLLAAVVSDYQSLKEAPHILDREPWREFVDGEGGEVRRRVLYLDGVESWRRRGVAFVLDASMQTQTESLAERVQGLMQESRKPLLATTQTSAAIAELVGRIEALELAIQQMADAVEVATSPRETA